MIIAVIIIIVTVVIYSVEGIYNHKAGYPKTVYFMSLQVGRAKFFNGPTSGPRGRGAI